MTKTEELKWRKSGRAYLDDFSGRLQVRQTLKKAKSGRGLTTKQRLLDEYWGRLSQLEFTHTRLKRFPVFLSSFHLALEKRGISRVTQFIYHIENYLAVIYIFDQRVRRITRLVEKLATKHRCLQTDIQALADAKKNLMASLEPLVTVRGSHTHEKYFSDKDFDEMEKYDKAGDFSSDAVERKVFKTSAKALLSTQRKRWKKDIQGDIGKCEIQMGILYAKLDKLVWQIHKKLTEKRV